MASFPAFWWRDRPLIFGHRGASHAAPQNTLAAFRKAAQMGADGVELDVHLSADGVPVVIHDDKVDATTDGAGFVVDMSLAQLKELDAGSRFGAPFAGERIPTLEEVFAEVGQCLLINVELKAPVRTAKSGRSMELEAAVVALIRRMAMQERVWFSSFKPYMLYQARALAPEIPCGLLYDPLSLGSLLLAPVTPHEALHPHTTLVGEGFVRWAHRRGQRVATWTVDSPEKAGQFAAWGVDVFISNEPEALVAVLA